MKFLTEWKLMPGQTASAAKRFLAGGASPPEGLTIIARWHKADLSGGIVIGECDDPRVIYDDAVAWADLVEIRVTPAISDDEAGPILAKHFG